MVWNVESVLALSLWFQGLVVVYYRKPTLIEGSDVGLAPMFDIGGRWHFTRPVALTFRLGYPIFSLGVSFLL